MEEDVWITTYGFPAEVYSSLYKPSEVEGFDSMFVKFLKPTCSIRD